jgi:hypothetical protein
MALSLTGPIFCWAWRWISRTIAAALRRPLLTNGSFPELIAGGLARALGSLARVDSPAPPLPAAGMDWVGVSAG